MSFMNSVNHVSILHYLDIVQVILCQPNFPANPVTNINNIMLFNDLYNVLTQLMTTNNPDCIQVAKAPSTEAIQSGIKNHSRCVIMFSSSGHHICLNNFIHDRS